MRHNEPHGVSPWEPDCRDLGYITRDMAKSIECFSMEMARLSGNISFFDIGTCFKQKKSTFFFQNQIYRRADSRCLLSRSQRPRLSQVSPAHSKPDRRCAVPVAPIAQFQLLCHTPSGLCVESSFGLDSIQSAGNTMLILNSFRIHHAACYQSSPRTMCKPID